MFARNNSVSVSVWFFGSEQETVTPPAEMGVLILGDSG